MRQFIINGLTYNEDGKLVGAHGVITLVHNHIAKNKEEPSFLWHYLGVERVI